MFGQRPKHKKDASSAVAWPCSDITTGKMVVRIRRCAAAGAQASYVHLLFIAVIAILIGEAMHSGYSGYPSCSTQMLGSNT